MNRDDTAARVFHKPYNALEIGARRDVDDFISLTADMNIDEQTNCLNMLIHPTWKESLLYDAEICSDGMSIRNPDTKQPIHLLYNKGTGYLYASVRNRSTGQYDKVAFHRLVAEAFVPNKYPSVCTVVHHINGDKTRNWPFNIKWVTEWQHKQLHSDRIRRGSNNNLAKYSDEQIEIVCQLLQAHPEWTFERIGIECNVDPHSVGKIYRGERWAHVSEKFRPFPERHNRRNQTGELNSMSKYSDEKIHQVCKILDDMFHGNSKMSYSDIASRLDVSVSLVRKLRQGQTHKEICSQYSYYKK